MDFVILKTWIEYDFFHFMIYSALFDITISKNGIRQKNTSSSTILIDLAYLLVFLQYFWERMTLVSFLSKLKIFNISIKALLFSL